MVGGKDGWILNHSENYNTWSQHKRLQINNFVCRSAPPSQFMSQKYTKEKLHKKQDLLSEK